MKIESTIYHINQACDRNDFAAARSTINKHWNRVTESRNYLDLNENAKQLVKIISSENQKAGVEVLSLDEKRIIQKMNQYVRDMRFANAKMTYNKHEELFHLPEAQRWLTKDAHIICEALMKEKK
ncbi:hypothetical protein [Domibacillus epiphyticus]|uniref:Uncharacterized protein n=1 Tax=Domibacillus epiphyticus TaxID=1714355 RepID=A0A1V2ACM7_9BACI|nr:hypothetical protein [Domibacillus epiphyticus]OMP68756.1 hypothetical protein BTO28_01540 [Domibacillus epiphyticus]